MIDPTRMPEDTWRGLAAVRFGDDPLKWRFVCPSCGHVAAVEDWRKSGAPEGAVAFSCVGRYTETPAAAAEAAFKHKGGALQLHQRRALRHQHRVRSAERRAGDTCLRGGRGGERRRCNLKPRQHASNTHWLGAAPGMTAEECTALPITRFEYPDGMPAVASFWQPNEHELQLLNAGKPLRLIALGVTHPPLMLGVDGDGLL